MKRILLWLIRFYQRRISPGLPPSCRFVPTCSEYARQAIEKYGALKGTYLAVRRLLKCHPFHPGGTIPSPENAFPSERAGCSRAPGILMNRLN